MAAGKAQQRCTQAETLSPQSVFHLRLYLQLMWSYISPKLVVLRLSMSMQAMTAFSGNCRRSHGRTSTPTFSSLLSSTFASSSPSTHFIKLINKELSNDKRFRNNCRGDHGGSLMIAVHAHCSDANRALRLAP